MAFRAANYAKSIMGRLKGSAAFGTSTSPKMKAYSPTVDPGYVHKDTKPRLHVKGEYAPVLISLGLITCSVSIGLYTALHELKYSPNVFVKKSRRETLPELVEPEKVIEDADKFIKKSFFRKVAHVQDFDRQEVTPDPIRGDSYAWSPVQKKAETLKSVGVEVEKKPFVEPPPVKEWHRGLLP